MNKKPERHPNILEAKKLVAKANENYNKVVAETQKTCPHEYVVFAKRESHEDDHYAGREDKRLCITCGLMESGANPKILKNEFVKHVTHGDLMWNY